MGVSKTTTEFLMHLQHCLWYLRTTPLRKSERQTILDMVEAAIKKIENDITSAIEKDADYTHFLDEVARSHLGDMNKRASELRMKYDLPF